MNKRMRVPIRICRLCSLPVVIGLLMGGCSGGTDDLRAYVNDLERKPKQPVPDILAPAVYPDFRYAPEALRNPFAPRPQPEDEAVKKPGTAAPDTTRIKEPLEQFRLDALTLVGVLRQADAAWALIRTPDGVVHKVTVGHRLGRNNGRILAIRETGLTLREGVADDGDGRQRTVEFGMPGMPGSKTPGPKS